MMVYLMDVQDLSNSLPPIGIRVSIFSLCLCALKTELMFDIDRLLQHLVPGSQSQRLWYDEG